MQSWRSGSRQWCRNSDRNAFGVGSPRCRFTQRNAKTAHARLKCMSRFRFEGRTAFARAFEWAAILLAPSLTLRVTAEFTNPLPDPVSVSAGLRNAPSDDGTTRAERQTSCGPTTSQISCRRSSFRREQLSPSTACCSSCGALGSCRVSRRTPIGQGRDRRGLPAHPKSRCSRSSPR